MTFRTKIEYVEAIRILTLATAAAGGPTFSADPLPDWFLAARDKPAGEVGSITIEPSGEQLIITVYAESGPYTCDVGSWIVRDSAGGLYVIDDVQFGQTFEPPPEDNSAATIAELQGRIAELEPDATALRAIATRLAISRDQVVALFTKAETTNSDAADTKVGAGELAKEQAKPEGDRDAGVLGALKARAGEIQRGGDYAGPAPSQGRIVQFFSSNPGLTGGVAGVPAIITYVHSSTCVNLIVFRDGAEPIAQTSVEMLLPGEDKAEGRGWAWPRRI